jgi:alkaline phosphatase D
LIENPFRHGVASGDPRPDGVVLWTRVTVPAHAPVPVEWWVADPDDPGPPLASGEAEACGEHDHTLHVEVDGLEPGRSYAYGFRTAGHDSDAGRTRTAPAGPTDALRLGLVSCGSYVAGWFTAYGHLAARDVDVVVHVGDYIYDHDRSRTPHVRIHEPIGQCLTLADYRTRYAQYRSDPNLRRLHRRFPMVAVWDDHEIAGSAWREGAIGHRRRDGSWAERRAAAIRAYREWLPVRPLAAGEDPLRIYRHLPFGDLVDLVMIDTRLIGRDRPRGRGAWPVASVGRRDRSLLGEPQRTWLRDVLGRSTARWKLVGNQVMLAPLRAVPVRSRFWGVNAGQWDGYPGEREDLLRFLADEDVGGVVVLTGDVHSSWASELAVDGDRPVAVEAGTPSITAEAFADKVVPGLPGAVGAVERLVRAGNPHHRWFDLRAHGYVVLDVTPERLRADWWHVESVTSRGADERLAASFEVAGGTNRWVRRD